MTYFDMKEFERKLRFRMWVIFWVVIAAFVVVIFAISDNPFESSTPSNIAHCKIGDGSSFTDIENTVEYDGVYYYLDCVATVED